MIVLRVSPIMEQSSQVSIAELAPTRARERTIYEKQNSMFLKEKNDMFYVINFNIMH